MRYGVFGARSSDAMEDFAKQIYKNSEHALETGSGNEGLAGLTVCVGVWVRWITVVLSTVGRIMAGTSPANYQ